MAVASSEVGCEEVVQECHVKVVNKVAAFMYDDVWKRRFREEYPEITEHKKALNLEDACEKKWSVQHGEVEEVDVLRSDFVNLPSSWQTEYLERAQAFVREIVSAHETGGRDALDDSFVEETAEKAHAIWRESNKVSAPAHRNCAYEKLGSADKEIECNQVRAVIGLCVKELKLG